MRWHTVTGSIVEEEWLGTVYVLFRLLLVIDGQRCGRQIAVEKRRLDDASRFDLYGATLDRMVRDLDVYVKKHGAPAGPRRGKLAP